MHPMNRVPLTRRQSEILNYVREYVAQNGISPTLEEIAHAFGVSRVTIFGHVGELEDKGFLKRPTRGISRGILLTHDGTDSQQESSDGASNQRAGVPILGSIAAGRPIAAVESEETFSFDDLIPPQADVYMLRVQGNSMIEDAICDGDMVLVEKRTTARNGETVVAILDDEETTLKRYYKETKGFRLQPANSAMAPIYADRVEIRGVVIGVIRQVH
jgi:repressor LexA